MESALPIWQVHAEILQHLTGGNRLVLVAPTGSGKTTQVPQMLLEAGLAGDKTIVVLQPRRVAARTVAARVAWERKGKLGQEVGYQIRFDDQTSLGTRICYVTEGILLRWLQDNPSLPDIGIVLFDEFHERNLLSDVSLALIKQIQQTTRPDLKVVVMSATLEAKPIAKFLPSTAPGSGTQPGPEEPCPIVVSEGRAFGVEVRYLEERDDRPVMEQAAEAVERIVNGGDPGDILVFMPGMAEINATINAVRAARTSERLAVMPLHGELQPEDQDRAFAPNALRKVVVATNVAETSVTIDGIRHVVDSGLARVARYDTERGIGTLFLEEISRASAEQRKGRAGRTAPGTCHRLWTESGHLNRPERNTPEIQRSDLAEVVLLLHSLGVRHASAFDWLDKPDPQGVLRAEKLLHLLGAIDPRTEHLTQVGRKMLRLPMHPRYSRMLLEAARHGCVPAAALCAALVSGRDLLVRLGREDQHIAEARELFEASQNSDFFRLLRAHEFARQRGFNVEQCRRYGIHAQTARQVEQTCDQILQIAESQGLLPSTRKESAAVESRAASSSAGSAGIPAGESPSHGPAGMPALPPHASAAVNSSLMHPWSGGQAEADRPGVSPEEGLLRSIMAGFVDQLCVRRDTGSLECALTEGRQGTLMRESVVQAAPLFVAASIREVESRGSRLTLLGLATAIQREWLQQSFPEHLSVQVEHLYDRTQKRVAAIQLVRFVDLVIHQQHQREVDPAASGRALAEAYGKGWFELPLFNHEIKQFIARVNLVSAALPELELRRFDQERILDSLARAFHGLTLAKEAQAAALRDAFRKQLPQGQLDWLDELAPTQIPWPDGRKLKLLYSEQALDEPGPRPGPEVQVKLPECFALKEHPLVCEGKVPVKLWLCGTDGKRVEATVDWPAFRANQYPKLKPVLQKRYPGVAWL